MAFEGRKVAEYVPYGKNKEGYETRRRTEPRETRRDGPFARPLMEKRRYFDPFISGRESTVRESFRRTVKGLKVLIEQRISTKIIINIYKSS